MTNCPTLSPRLIVRDAAAAIDFYCAAFGAELRQRFAEPDGTIVHAELTVGDAVVMLKDEDGTDRSPQTLGGAAVILALSVDDPDAAVDRAVRAGATVVFPVADRFYGARDGRIADPYGHVWIVSRSIEALSDEEIQRRISGG